MQQNETEKSDDGNKRLSERQIKTLPLLAMGGTLTESARFAGIDRTTFYQWLEDETFRAEYQRLRDGAAELKGLMLNAAQVIGSALRNADAGIRFKAAKMAIDAGLKGIDMADIERRISRLDDWVKKGRS